MVMYGKRARIYGQEVIPERRSMSKAKQVRSVDLHINPIGVLYAEMPVRAVSVHAGGQHTWDVSYTSWYYPEIDLTILRKDQIALSVKIMTCHQKMQF
jgi:hypothetical protein